MDIGTALTAVTTIISIASLIAASTKTRVDDEWQGKLYRLVDLLALNFGHAKSKGEE